MAASRLANFLLKHSVNRENRLMKSRIEPLLRSTWLVQIVRGLKSPILRLLSAAIISDGVYGMTALRKFFTIVPYLTLRKRLVHGLGVWHKSVSADLSDGRIGARLE